MMTIQALRRSRGITLTDLALLSGIPARTLASIEYGVQTLDYRTREQLAHIFGVPPASLLPGAPPALQAELRRRLAEDARLAAPVVGLALATAALLAPALQPHLAHESAVPAPVSAQSQRPQAQRVGVVQAIAPASLGLADDVSAAALVAAWPVESDSPAAGEGRHTGGPKAHLGPAAAVAFVASADGTPYGCPVATSGRAVITQGYGVGTHAPAAIWGGLDLAVDGDGDGQAEVAATRGVLVFAPHAGDARVTLNSWPGGNYVRVTNSQSGWATAYAHLDQVFVSDGQWLEAGTVIGTIGATGQTSGPHLHYEVWRNGVNVDPSPYVRCGA
jgi:murein DD-endopeptidase MepM/ murein hydrolase activator NlpD